VEPGLPSFVKRAKIVSGALFLVVILVVVVSIVIQDNPWLLAASDQVENVAVSADRLASPWRQKVPRKVKSDKCGDIDAAWRYIEDDFFSEKEVEVLLAMVKKGMQGRSLDGGPTILDVNSGFIKDGDGVTNIYRGENRVRFTKEEYQVYGEMFERIRRQVMEINGLDHLSFTAPTFVARIIGNDEWQPKEIHDEYWQPHVDKENTEHYDFSGLVYLSTHGEDFQGGEFMFLDVDRPRVVLPRKGRFITFASGSENPHRFAKVTQGTRFCFSMWFSCDSTKAFSTFLDGEEHQLAHETAKI